MFDPVDAARLPSNLPPWIRCETSHRLRLASRWGVELLRPSKFPAISLAQSPEALQRVGKLRYELVVYRDRMSYPADHVSETLLENIDRLSLNFQATDRQRCLSAIRLTRGQDALEDRQLSRILLNCDLARPPLFDCILLSRLVVRREPRARLSLLELLRHSYGVGLMQGARYALLATRPPLVPMIKRFGFITTAKRLLDPIAGEIEILALDLRDRDHLRKVSSPLLVELDAHLAHPVPSIEDRPPSA